MSFFENTKKPEGFGGKIMVAMMNSYDTLDQPGFLTAEVIQNDKAQ